MDNNIKALDLQEKTYLGIILDFFLQYWKLFLVSFVICFASAFLYLKYAGKAYQVNAKVILKDDEKGAFNSQADMLTDFGFQSTNTNVENEIEVLTSKSVVELAVRRAGLYVKYAENGFFVDRPIYKNVSRVQAAMTSEALDELTSGLSIALELNSDSLYSVSYSYYNRLLKKEVESRPIVVKEYPYVLSTEVGDVLLTENPEGTMLQDVTISIYNPSAMASAYQGSLGVAPVSKTASVAIVAVAIVIAFWNNDDSSGLEDFGLTASPYEESYMAYLLENGFDGNGTPNFANAEILNFYIIRLTSLLFTT